MRKARECHDEKSTSRILSKLHQEVLYPSQQSQKPQTRIRFNSLLKTRPPQKKEGERERSKQPSLQFSVL